MRGKSGHVPFWPGGLDDVLPSSLNLDRPDAKGLRTIPPGFSRGLRLPGEEIEDQTLADLEGLHVGPWGQDDFEVSQLPTLITRTN